MADPQNEVLKLWKRIGVLFIVLFVASNIAWGVAFVRIALDPVWGPKCTLKNDLDLLDAYPAESDCAPINGIAKAGTGFDIHSIKGPILYVSFHTIIDIEALKNADSVPPSWYQQ